MADEWSKPVKDGRIAFWSSRKGAEFAGVSADNFEVSDAEGAIEMPRDVVLRLLAAETSDRLGWEWVAFRASHVGPLFMHCKDGEWWFDDGTSGRGTPVESPPTFRFVPVKDGSGFLPYLTPDELLAAMHGRFLLEDALREAGR